MDEVSVIGIDLAKSVFEISLQASDGRVVQRRRLRRQTFERFMQQAPRVLVGLEAGPVQPVHPLLQQVEDRKIGQAHLAHPSHTDDFRGSGGKFCRLRLKAI